MDASEQVIVALDVADAAEALALVAELAAVRFWKVGLELFTAAGPALVKEIKSRGKRVFLDLKFHDIPNTAAGACRSATRLGVDLLTVHAAGGRAMLAAAATACHEEAERLAIPAPTVLAVTVLTSLNAAALNDELAVGLPLADYVRHLARLADESGIGGLVCSPLEVAALRTALGPERLLVTPGIRPAGAKSEDQSRTLTPAEAIAAGANYLVVGRPILAAPDPAAAFEAIVASVRQVAR